MNNIELRDTFWASVSGGKDSLLMFQLIVKNPDKYPLNGVVHFELEIDYPNVWKQYVDYLRIEEEKVSAKFGKKWVLRGSNIKYDWLYTKNIVETKWLAKLEEKENEQ